LEKKREAKLLRDKKLKNKLEKQMILS
jgi:hypothetical protein